MSDQDFTKSPAIVRPLNDDKEAWVAYWMHQCQPWRTEPEIDPERQSYLNERRRIIADMKENSYPFKDIKLTRADVEWLLATHENGQGPVDWSDTSQRTRKGIDLCGANLCYVDLRCLGFSIYSLAMAIDLKEVYSGICLSGSHATLNAAHLKCEGNGVEQRV
jgi:hypothetical protein